MAKHNITQAAKAVGTLFNLSLTLSSLSGRLNGVVPLCQALPYPKWGFFLPFLGGVPSRLKTCLQQFVDNSTLRLFGRDTSLVHPFVEQKWNWYVDVVMGNFFGQK